MDYKVQVNSSLHGNIEVFINTKGTFPLSGTITGFCVNLNTLVRFTVDEVISYEENYVHA